MTTPLYIHRYRMRSSVALNARSIKQEHEGALIRVGNGFGCLHPWPELGDAPLERLLQILKEGRTPPIIRAALHCAREDGKAREEGRNLLAGVNVPKSHGTVMMTETSVAQAVTAGFTTMKVKMGRSLKMELEFILAQAERFPELRWRIDFNSLLGKGAVEGVLNQFPVSFREKIDFIEDPCVYEGAIWKELRLRYGIPMAIDRDVEKAGRDIRVAVLKPAVDVLHRVLEQAYLESRRVVFTSYMDHPLGQSYAAWRAALAAKEYPGMIDLCGLVTHGLFEPDDFSSRMGEPRPEFPVAQGSGLGFDDLLETLPWMRLI